MNNKKAYIHTFGCKVNQYDSQVLREELDAGGYREVCHFSRADVVIINSCTVTHEADRQCRQLIRKIRAHNPTAHVVVTGCYAQRKDESLASFEKSVTILPRTVPLHTVLISLPISRSPARHITSFKGHTRAFVKIQDGCSSFCSYCVVPYVRPHLWSKSIADTVTEVTRLVKNGYPEIVLTGVQLGHYAYGLPHVLRELMKIDAQFRIRLSSLNATYVTDELCDVFKQYNPCICPHLHLSLQSGSDSVLKRMNRTYTTREFLDAVIRIRGAVPDIGITTDVIVGFPGETEDDFNMTKAFIKQVGFSRLHVFRYSPRNGTRAAAFTDTVTSQEKKKRARILQELDGHMQEGFWKKFVGSRQLIVEETKQRGLTGNYITVQLQQVNTHRNRKKTGKHKLYMVEIKNVSGRPHGVRIAT